MRIFKGVRGSVDILKIFNKEIRNQLQHIPQNTLVKYCKKYSLVSVVFVSSCKLSIHLSSLIIFVDYDLKLNFKLVLLLIIQYWYFYELAEED